MIAKRPGWLHGLSSFLPIEEPKGGWGRGYWVKQHLRDADQRLGGTEVAADDVGCGTVTDLFRYCRDPARHGAERRVVTYGKGDNLQDQIPCEIMTGDACGLVREHRVEIAPERSACELACGRTTGLRHHRRLAYRSGPTPSGRRVLGSAS